MPRKKSETWRVFGKMAGLSALAFILVMSACGELEDIIKEQQDKNKNDDQKEPCKTNLDPDKVYVQLGTLSSGGDLVIGEAGATDPGATVTITDAEGKSVERTANDEGGFAVPIAALRYKRGDCVTLTVKVDDCEPATMEVCVPKP